MNSFERRRILVSGSVARDIIQVVPHSFLEIFGPSELKHNISVSMLSKTIETRYGGTGANICHTLALLGEKPILLGSVGQTREDDIYLKALAELGVDTRHIHRSPEKTATFTAFTDPHNNQIACFFVGAMGDSGSLSVLIPGVEQHFVVISPHDPKQMLTQVEEVKTHSLRMMFDLGQQVNNSNPDLLHQGVAAAEVLILNDYERRVLAEKLAISEQELQEQVPVCVTTKSKDGSEITGSNIPVLIQIPIATVKKVIDPTGAGDAYRAGFLYGYVRGWPLETCGEMGAMAAAFAIEQFGGQSHSFTKEQFQSRYQDNFHKQIVLE